MSAIDPIVKPQPKPLSRTGWRGVAGAMLLALGLSACGQKGPLFIPTPNTTAPTSASASP